jgi:hypothetical protein
VHWCKSGYEIPVCFDKSKDLLPLKIPVSVKLHPEPNNPKDARAIAFKCIVDGQWHRIRYIVREVLDEVHEIKLCLSDSRGLSTLLTGLDQGQVSLQLLMSARNVEQAGSTR